MYFKIFIPPIVNTWDPRVYDELKKSWICSMEGLMMTRASRNI